VSRARSAAFITGNLLLFYALLIVYVSLSPFSGWHLPESGWFKFLFDAWPKYVSRFDLAINTLAYMPLGFLLYAYLINFASPASALAASIAAGALLSLAMETLQVLIPVRYASNLDWLINCVGTACGALISVWFSKYTALETELIALRQRVFIAGRSVDSGIVLLVAWVFSQLNPSVPFLAAGVAEPFALNPWDYWTQRPESDAPFAVGTALNLCGVGLLVTVLTRGRMIALVVLQTLIAAALSVKVLAAQLLLKPEAAASWQSQETLVGLALGFLVLLPLCLFRLRTRVYLSAFFILAGGILSKLAAHYANPLAVLRLFNWPYGQLLNFTGLTLFLNELWPLAALLFLLYYLTRRREAERMRLV
jgi:VanZ family protein